MNEPKMWIEDDDTEPVLVRCEVCGGRGYQFAAGTMVDCEACDGAGEWL